MERRRQQEVVVVRVSDARDAALWCRERDDVGVLQSE
jgi:hypothetical protein